MAASPARAQTAPQVVYAWTNFVGQPGGPGNAAGMGTEARFTSPYSAAVDGQGNVYVADEGNHTIRRISPAGDVTTLAGSAGLRGSTDGTGSGARFCWPRGVTVDGEGNVYVADTNNFTIRKITPGGIVTTLAGQAGSYGSTDGTGSEAHFTGPIGVAADTAGNIYVTDSNTLRKVTATGVVTTLAGKPGYYGSADGTGSAARFHSPRGIAIDCAGNIYVADTTNSTIRKVTSAGVVTTLAGKAGYPGSTDATGSAARFNGPSGVAVDSAGNVYVADTSNYTVRKVTPTGAVTTLAGSAGESGSTDGAGGTARFGSEGMFQGPFGVAADSGGNVYVADTCNNMIRKVTSAGVVTTVAGSPSTNGSADGTGRTARFGLPFGLATDRAGSVYVADSANNTIRRITPAGEVITLAGSPGLSGSTDATGSDARFNSPYGVALDSNGYLYVADSLNSTIRKVTPSGDVTTLAGSAGSHGSADGIGNSARFYCPAGLAIDGQGNVYVADGANDNIRRVTPAGDVITLVGSAGLSGSTDATGSDARFYSPYGVTVDSAGNAYVADQGNDTVRKVTPAEEVTTLAGLAGTAGSADGTGSAARFGCPTGVAVDSEGNIYVADSGYNTIRRVTLAGMVSTIGGRPGVIGQADGIGGSAGFSNPMGITVDTAGNVYVADTSNNRISKGTPLPIPYSPGPTDRQTNLPTGSPLTWSGVASGITFDLYLDTVNPPTTKVASGLTDVTFTPMLDLATRYYWKVVAIHALGPIEGPVWTFTTHLPADIDGDGAVILADLKLLVAAWNSTPASPNWNPAADIDADQTVGLPDLRLLVANWNRNI